MYSHKKKKTKWIWIGMISFLILFFALGYFGQKDRTLSRPEAFLKDLVVGVEKTIFSVFQSKGKAVDQTQSDVVLSQLNVSLQQEIVELKKALSLNQTMSEYEVVNATVLSRNPAFWFSNLTIDRGRTDGLDEGMIAITKDGLIGKITKVTSHTSEIQLLTTEDADYKISVEILTPSGNVPALLNGFDSKTKQLFVIGVDQSAEVAVGQSVITSGMGGVFPRGIAVGTVVKIENDKYDMSKKLLVETVQDFNQLHYVSILKRVKS